MEKITVERKSSQPAFSSPKTEKKVMTFYLDSFLLEKARNMIKGRQLGGNYELNTTTDLIVKCLTLFQKKELVLSGERNLNNPRIYTSFSLPVNLVEFYLNFPKGQRIGILERCLISFLKEWGSEV